MNIEDRVAVITGASGALGKAVARRLADGGARLALLGRGAKGLERLAGELGLAEDRYLAMSADLSDPDSARQAAAAVIDRFGRVDMLVHLVGGWAGGTPVLEVPSAEVSGMLRQHVWTTLNAVQAFVPHMVERDWGRIVAVSQPAALQPAGNASSYAIGKAGQEVMLLSLAQELRDTGGDGKRRTRPGNRRARGGPRFEDDAGGDRIDDRVPLIRRSANDQRRTNPGPR
jgi:NAD(P)-dependent dehydrogenase (short-subunit alcohol dehydrogenase family)